ncbi:uromodulin-like 1 [Rhinatrema bivittatum]|uniref:uromodulin-like 1 n=1 Tax=Rhinatrema bivittatum TaxID=194408 RepID=UPI00112D911B|nr:uromodulin-like 1 [Rhinatrema bivittatum]
MSETCRLNAGAKHDIYSKNGLSSNGYYLCNYTTTKNVTKVVAYQKAYEATTACGWWVPWKNCSKTYYKTEYHTIEVPETMTSTGCCQGYEQMGHYCVLPLNRSSEFASKPGTCPMRGLGISKDLCVYDIDCPGLQKCCNSSGGSVCAAPIPQGLNKTHYWYIVTILVKMNLKELRRVDPSLLQHTRLLHSLITGALWPGDTSVHHLSTVPSGAFTISSELLVGLCSLQSLENVSSQLSEIPMRLPEVIDVDVKGANVLCLQLYVQALGQDRGPLTPSDLPALLPETSTSTATAEKGGMPASTESAKAGVPNATYSNHMKLPLANTSSPSLGGETPLSPSPNLITPKPRTTPSMTSAEHRQGLPSPIPVSAAPEDSSRAWLQNITDSMHNFSTNLTVTEGPAANTSAIYREILGPYTTPGQGMMNSSRNQPINVSIPSAVSLSFPSATPSDCVDPANFRPIANLPLIAKLMEKIVNKQLSDYLEENTILAPSQFGFRKSLSTESLLISLTDTILTNLDKKQPYLLILLDLSAAFDTVNYSTLLERLADIGIKVLRPIRRLMATNVSSTSFTVSWSADHPPTSHFRVLLLRGDQILSEISTGNVSFSTWGLEPGVFYTVKVLTQACGQNRKEAQLTLRTAIQMLVGRARIINANYTPGLSNVTTKEYQNFTQLFTADVYNSLPPHILSSVKAGEIKMLITNVTNGSVIIDFHLLIAMSWNITDVSLAFLSSLANTSLFLVDGSTLTIYDYDECENHANDCSPYATCTNTLGFYTCSCKDGFMDLNLQWPGRACEAAVQPNSTFTSQAPAPGGQHETALGTTLQTTFLPEVTTSLASGNLAQSISMREAATVNCEIKYIVLIIDKRFLQQKSIPESSLYLGQPQCNVSMSNKTHVELRAGWTECGTLVQSNKTHTMVNTTLRNNMSTQKPVQHTQLISPIRCLFPNDVLASSGYTPEGLYTIIEDLQGDGSFEPEFQLFDGDNPIPKNSTLSPSDEVRIQVRITTEDSELKVVLTECWATPTSNSLDPVSIIYINASCSLPNTFTIMLENGVSHKAQFKTKIFAFVNTSVVYLHCKLHICLEMPGKTCRTSCNGVRSLKSSDLYVTRHASWGPLCQGASYSHPKSPEDHYLAPGYIALIVIAICAFVAGVTALVACRYQRRTGRYDFKLKSDVGYQVFYN